MTNEQAIKIIQNEYKCVDQECDIERSCGKCPYMMPTKEPILQAYGMAIQALSSWEEYSDKLWKEAYERGKTEALSQEPCDECRNKRTSFCGNCKEYDEFEPCDDAISREQLLKVVTGDSFKSDFPRMSKALMEIIKALPSVSTTKNIVNHGTMNITL